MPDLDSCSAFGATAEEALAEVEKARDAWLAAARDAGKAIPEPRYRPAFYTRSTSRRPSSSSARVGRRPGNPAFRRRFGPSWSRSRR
jgi:predicted RNase H-like HicB family nuclease